MHWLLLGIIALALIVVAGRHPRTAFGLFAALLAGTILMLQLSSGEKERGSALISPGDVLLSRVHFKPGYAGSFDLSGRLANQASDAQIVEVVLEVQLRDCHPPDQGEARDCQVLGTESPRLVLAVPPGEARDFMANLSFPRTQSRGEIDWTYRVIAVLGRRYRAAVQR